MGVSALMEEDQDDKHEEFQEFEVLFPETTQHQQKKKKNGINSRLGTVRTTTTTTCVTEDQNQKKVSGAMSNSVPVKIPGGFRENPCLKRSEFDEILEFEDGMEMVPPHLILDRRASSRRMAFSVCTGNGRTLKGRDLCRVRNSVLRMTGFIETC